MSSKTIHLEAVGKRFERGKTVTTALETIDLTIGAGEFVAVVGPSGCGKSTLMRLAAGLLLPSTGTDRKSTRLNSSHIPLSRMPSSA